MLENIAGTHGATFSFCKHRQLACPDSSLCVVKNHYRDSTKIYIGVNHTGSWSTIEAIKDVWDQPLFVVEDYTVAKSDEIPTLAQQLSSLKEQLEPHYKTIPSLIYSHLGMPIHPALNKLSKFEYLTMLRNPISRFISVYYWTYKHRHADVHWVPDIIKKGATIDQYVDYYATNKIYPGGLDPCCYFYNAWNEMGFIPADITSDVLASARHVLERYFSFVGITELYDESLFILAGFLGLKKLPVWKFFGSSGRPNPENINPAVIRKIASLVQVDTELYTCTREKFEQEYSFEIAYFRKKIGTLCSDDHYIEAPNML